MSVFAAKMTLSKSENAKKDLLKIEEIIIVERIRVICIVVKHLSKDEINISLVMCCVVFLNEGNVALF